MKLMNMRQFFAIVEIRTKIVSVSTYLLATLWLLSQGVELKPLRAVLLFIAMLLVDMGTTGFNTYFDYRNGVDHADWNREDSKVVVHEGVPWGWALMTSLALFALAVPFGIFLAVLSGWPVILAGAGGMAIGFFYTGGRRPISRTPFGELFAGGALGCALFLLVCYVHAGIPGRSDLLASLPSTFLIASILTVNNTCDIEGDSEAGRRTLSILLGKRGGELAAIGEVAVGFGLLFIAGFVGFLPPWSPLAVLPLAALSARELTLMHRRGYNHGTKGPSMGGISRIFLLFTVAGAIALVGEIIS